MSNPSEYEQMLDKTVDAYEQSTGSLPVPYELAEIESLVREYVDGTE